MMRRPTLQIQWSDPVIMETSQQHFQFKEGHRLLGVDSIHLSCYRYILLSPSTSAPGVSSGGSFWLASNQDEWQRVWGKVQVTRHRCLVYVEIQSGAELSTKHELQHRNSLCSSMRHLFPVICEFKNLEWQLVQWITRGCFNSISDQH